VSRIAGAPTWAWRPPRLDLGGDPCGQPGQPEVDRIFHDEASVRRLIARFPQPGKL
jgi:hypothetical protein